MARSTFIAYALTIAGIQHVFTTRSVGTITSTSALWWGGETGVTYADGYLAQPDVQWTERAKPLDGDLDIEGLRFTLHDAKQSGATYHLLTRLATMDAARVTSTPLSATVTSAATSWTVGSGSTFTSPCFAWCNREVVRITNIAGNTLTVTRGVLGTKARAQTVDADSVRYPEVYTECPWTTRRKVVLWGVKSDLTAVPLWVGFATRAPELSSDGARFDLSCEPLWNVLRGCPVGDVTSTARLVGYTGNTGGGIPALLTTRIVVPNNLVTRTVAREIFRDWDALIDSHTADIESDTTARGTRVDMTFTRSGASAEVNADATAAFHATIHFLGEGSGALTATYRTATRYSLTATLEKVPNAAAVFLGYGATTLPVSSLRSLPASWAASSWSDAGLTTSSTPGLRVHYDKEWSVLLTAISTADSGASGPRVSGTVTVMARKYTSQSPPMVLILRDPPPFQYVTRVRTEHWLYAIKRAVVDLCADGDANDWDWTNIATYARLLTGLDTSRDWIFDGRRTFGAVVTEACQLFGCTPIVTGGLLTIRPWRWPDVRESSAATFTRTDLIGMPTWSRWPEGLANRIQVKSEELTIDATQAGSVDRYGPGRQITVELAGAEDQARVTGDPIEFSRAVLARMELWSDPLSVVRITVTLDYLPTVLLGDVVTVSEWMLPDGAGARGLAAKRGVVVARTIDLQTATLGLELLLFARSSYPYAPCAKVSTLVASDTVSLASGYVTGSTTYSGAADISNFAAGDVCQFVVRNSTTLTTDTRTIQSVNSGAGQITFTSALSAGMQAAITGGSWVDLRFASYSSDVSTQKANWMFVGDDATNVIDGTADPVRPISP